MIPHVIRLRGPWQYEALTRTRRRADGSSETVPGELPPPGQIHVPSDWGEVLGADFRGRVRCSRRFNRPSGMSRVRRIDLVIQGVDALRAVALNDHPLDTIPPSPSEFRWEITSQLKPHNVLTVEIEVAGRLDSSSPPPRGGRSDHSDGLMGEIRLEIFAAD